MKQNIEMMEKTKTMEEKPNPLEEWNNFVVYIEQKKKGYCLKVYGYESCRFEKIWKKNK